MRKRSMAGGDLQQIHSFNSSSVHVCPCAGPWRHYSTPRNQCLMRGGGRQAHRWWLHKAMGTMKWELWASEKRHVVVCMCKRLRGERLCKHGWNKDWEQRMELWADRDPARPKLDWEGPASQQLHWTLSWGECWALEGLRKGVSWI